MVATSFPVRIKDPDAVLDYPFDWSEWLAPGETIVTSDFTVSAGISVDSSSFTLSSATVWLSGGSPGTPYLVTNRITTSGSRTDDRSITVKVQNR